MKPFYEQPCAAAGLLSYRYPTPGGGFIMIGARDDADAVNEANRSLDRKAAILDKLEKWNGTKYVPAV